MFTLPLLMEFQALFMVFLMSWSSLREALIFRSLCCRDTLMKLMDRDKKLTGTAQDVISEIRVAAVRYCVRLCAKENNCISVNFKSTQREAHERNCQLLKITMSEGTLTVASGWMHYEPVSQLGARCRSFPCSAGYECIEQCQAMGGYKCIDINECASNPCQNHGTCSNQINKYACTCAADHQGTNCEQEVPKQNSCRDIKLASGTTQNDVYQFWDSTSSTHYEAYCDMANGGWTLIARFSNADAKNWIATSGSYWYDQTAVGSTTSTSANGDMINKAFYIAKGTDMKITRSDSTSHGYLLYSNGCLSSTTFRSKITSYGDFRNNKPWSRNQCLGQCSVNSYFGVSRVSGFSQYSCIGEIQSSQKIGFWCHVGSGDASVIMIGGGGSSCARADHGIAITEENDPRFGTIGTMDFGDDSRGSSSYALNLWIR